MLTLALYVFVAVIIAVTITIQLSGDSNSSGTLLNPLKPSELVLDTSTEGKRLQAVLAGLADYKKGEEQTYLTIPEWYLVFNPVEYADFLSANNNPGDFPFFQSINEYWVLYDRVIALTRDVYPDNDEYLTMLRVIGISTTLEYMMKGMYEGTIGRLTYWISSAKTVEEGIITSAHQAYAKLIHKKAWYEFPFADWVGKIWRETSFFGPNFIRRTERKLSFTLEFAIKTVYAKLIGLASATAYGAAVESVTMVVKADTAMIADLDPRVTLIDDPGDGYLIIQIPRWGDFSEIMPKLAAAGVSFIEISGNANIAVTVLADVSTTGEIDTAQFLFESKVFSPANRKRLVYSVNVPELAGFMNAGVSQGLTLEHVFDY